MRELKNMALYIIAFCILEKRKRSKHGRKDIWLTASGRDESQLFKVRREDAKETTTV